MKKHLSGQVGLGLTDEPEHGGEIQREHSAGGFINMSLAPSRVVSLLLDIGGGGGGGGGGGVLV